MFYVIVSIVAGTGIYAYAKKHPGRIGECAASLKKLFGM
jgi:hypothetical protein